MNPSEGGQLSLQSWHYPDSRIERQITTME
jgi:hypothetical protein